MLYFRHEPFQICSANIGNGPTRAEKDVKLRTVKHTASIRKYIINLSRLTVNLQEVDQHMRSLPEVYLGQWLTYNPLSISFTLFPFLCFVWLLTLCLLGNFSCFLSSADSFSKLTFSKNYFRNIIRVSNSLDPDQARRFVGPNLGPSSVQR